MLICIGAANVLANPKRLLKSLPGALYEIGVAVTVALTVAPQLVESVQRVRRARRLRGERGQARARWSGWSCIPVLEDALDRSLLLAAAMDSRGYGRAGRGPAAARAAPAAWSLGGLVGVCVGVYGLLDGTAPRWTRPADAARRGRRRLGSGSCSAAGACSAPCTGPTRGAAPEWAVAAVGRRRGGGHRRRLAPSTPRDVTRRCSRCAGRRCRCSRRSASWSAALPGLAGTAASPLPRPTPP